MNIINFDDIVKKEMDGLSCLTVLYFISCSSYVGRTGKLQDITLGKRCWTRGVVAHEIGKFPEISCLSALYTF